ncbi:Protein transport protein Sec24B [Dermatophagoides farinae]|uniref:Protein transport protein Sec24B n=2 Tax=Dermatophagoides farinae TaxID=6954 RepID=A0A922KY79_DERFA|nr:protein transport protein Sec24B-like [Dermatophagoides farinae]KAH9501497.1 Protein transport protein Sec24B [Dermatophagoides farinae]
MNRFPPPQMMYPNAFPASPQSPSSTMVTNSGKYPSSPPPPPPPVNNNIQQQQYGNPQQLPQHSMMMNHQQQQQQQPPPQPPPVSSLPHFPQQQYPSSISQMNQNIPPQQQQQQPPPLHNHSANTTQQHHHLHQHHGMDQLTQKMGSMVVNQGWNQMFNRLEAVNLLAEKDIYTKAVQQKRQQQQQQQLNSQQQQQQRRDDLSCDKDVMRCTMHKIPETASLLQKSRLPLGILLHPFKDDPNIPVIQDSVIVRCRSCRTYINPYVRLLDQRRWQCNLCHRINEVPEEFIYDYQSRRMIDIMTRPELNHGSIEFVASVEYMVRPPQPAIYLFVFECTSSAVQLGYIRYLASALLASIDQIPGDSRTLIGFIAFDSKLHFFNLNDDRPVHMIMPDIHDVFLPHADCLLVKFHSCRDKIEYFLRETLPNFPCNSNDDDPNKIVADHQSALGPALQAAFRLISPTGGRITLIQTSLPSAGNLSDGCVLQNREDPNQRTINSNQSNQALTPLLNPATDFFKKLALECSEHQVTVDLFNLSPSFSDLATVAAIAKYSGGSIKYYGGSGTGAGTMNPLAINSMLLRFEEDMKHYLTRSIGFEAVMRLRSTRGINIHTFHGNFFVRSTDLIALPNVNPDSAYGIQLSISEDLRDFNQICFQAALLYTNSTGERRIRVHTIALPVVSDLIDIMDSADHDAITSLLTKMAVDRSCQASIQDAREALINANIDLISAFRLIHTPPYPGLFISYHTRLLPLYTLALLKNTAFRLGISTRIDERVYAMEQMKSMPLKYIMLYIYPHLYPLHHQFDPKQSSPMPLQLSFANIDRNGVYLLDTYDHLFIYICKSVHPQFLSDVFNVTQWSQIPDEGDQQQLQQQQQSQAAFTTPPSIAMMTRPPQSSLNNNTNHNHAQMNGFLPNQMMTMNNNNGMDDPPSTSTDTSSNDIVAGGAIQNNDQHSSTANNNVDDDNNLTLATKQKQKRSPCPLITLPFLNNETSEHIHEFIEKLLDDRPFKPSFHILREDSRLRYSFLQYMYDDRNESAFSYYEFLQHLQQNLEK